MDSSKLETGQWSRTVASKKGKIISRSPACKFNPLTRKSTKQPCLNSQAKPPKCFIKITGSRYNGTFLLNIDEGMDDAIYHTMRDIEVALEEQVDPFGKPRVSPKNCLSSVFRCFGTSDLQTKALSEKRKPRKSVSKPTECSLTAAINKSDLGPLINAVQSNSFNVPSEDSNVSMMRDVVDVFRTTLDQLCKESLNALDVAPATLIPQLNIQKQTPFKNSKTETGGRTKQSNEALKNVSFIKFSQEEVLAIQPPKPSDKDPKEMEVGIEIKPKSTALNVGQSIKLAKDKVLIGVQNGRGVIQIKDGIPKRSLQMVIEEGVDGKPSVKLSVNEENPEQENQSPEFNSGIKNPETIEAQKSIYINPTFNGNESASTCAHSNHIIGNNGPFQNKLKSYKSVESQVSCARLKKTDSHELHNDKFKSESTQCEWNASSESPPASLCTRCTVELKPQSTDANVESELSEVSQVMVLDSPCFRNYSETPKPRESRINRMPFLVHTLYESRSRSNSSAYFVSNKPSTQYSSTGRGSVSKKLEASKRQIKKTKSFTFSSDYSNSSKCTTIFRDIGELGVKYSKPAGNKDASITTSVVEDFEKTLQNMCGSSYLYHQPEPKPLSGMKNREQVLSIVKPSSGNLSFDQWTQTDSCSQKAGFEPTKKDRSQADKPIRIGDSGDGSHSRISRKKVKTIESNASVIVDESSFSTSGLEDGVSSDSSDSNKQLVFSVFEAMDKKPMARSSSQLVDENCLVGKAESVVGQKIFAAIKNATNHPELLGGIKETDSFVKPTCKDAYRVMAPRGSNVNVVNTALYEGPTCAQMTLISEDPGEDKMTDASLMAPCIEIMIPPEFREELDHNRTFQHMNCNRPPCPVRVKSKSCQNLSLAPNGSQLIGSVKNEFIGESKIKKLRYPHLTATSSYHKSTFNACGILNFNEGNMKMDGLQRKSDELTPKSEYALPSAIRSLLLPQQQSLIFNEYEQVPTYCCDLLASNNTADYLDPLTAKPTENDWYAPNEAFDYVSSVVFRRSLFKRTFYAMKTVRTAVTRKFSSIFQKLSFTHPDKRKKNSAINDNLDYVPIPLKKKSENLHLYPRKQ